jgi:hypothetical protein
MRRGPPELLSRRLLLPEAPSGQKNPRKRTLLLKLTDPLPPPMMLVNTLYLLSLYNLYSYASLFCQALMKKFITLGTECAEYLKVAKASEGKFF